MFVNRGHVKDVVIHVHNTTSGTEKEESYDYVHHDIGTTCKDHSDRGSIPGPVRSVKIEYHREKY